MSSDAKLNPHWIVGFVDGEGCFYVGVNPNSEMTAGFQVLPEFTVVQHRRDEQLLHKIKNFFGCGVVRNNHDERLAYRVRSVEHLIRTILPFFDRNPLQSRKRQDYLKFRDVLLIMERGEHLAKDGIERIRKIASRMNTGSVKIESSPPETDGND